jgi:hypothetical protein
MCKIFFLPAAQVAQKILVHFPVYPGYGEEREKGG